jgi:putative nucleotidyltransferase with HDIG domain
METRYINVKDLRSGMVLSDTVKDVNQRMLLGKGTVLTRSLIQVIRQSSLKEIPIGDPPTPTLPEVSPKARRNLRTYRMNDPEVIHFTHDVRSRIMDGVRTLYTEDDVENCEKTAYAISEELLGAMDINEAVAINVAEFKICDEYTYRHCVEVAAISMVIAKHMRYSRNEIRDIGVAGLLHDIGKMRIPPEIINKPGRLTAEEMEIVKKHSLYSYEMIQDKTDLTENIKLGVLQHHEKTDGSGYPYGLKEDQINPYAEILAVADIYDALISQRPYKKPYSPKTACEMMYAMSGILALDPLRTLFRCIIIYPVDSIVYLSNGMTCKVAKQNDGYPLRPVVVVLQDGRVYDLVKEETQTLEIL